ncbi:universal stress protein [Photobacterium carnosum]|uniref:universal stress protein n=1 Tax=Photobacterium carnosum TaxID=2023717 RepID=UPI001E492A5F|nr:universal stress protein [Photobacterium carnosum]MCD9517111.1 universal stress global response regulator UspA [Photobacterium carnosum]
MDKDKKCYQHILAAIDLSEDSDMVIRKAENLAKVLNIPLSLIYINNSCNSYTNDSYAYVTLPILVSGCNSLYERNQKENAIKLQNIVNKISYPLTNILSIDGDFTEQMEIVIKELEIDLVCCGHRHDFLSKFMSTTNWLRNKIKIDFLIVPLNS